MCRYSLTQVSNFEAAVHPHFLYGHLLHQALLYSIKLVFAAFLLYNHTALSRKSKDWLAHNQNNVSEWSDMSNRGWLFQ